MNYLSIRSRLSYAWFLFLVGVGNVCAKLPGSGDDASSVLPDNVAVDKPTSTLVDMLAWGAIIFASVMMLAAVVAGGFYLIAAFGKAQEVKGGYGGFIMTTVGVLVLIGFVIGLGVVGIEWAGDLRDVGLD